MRNIRSEDTIEKAVRWLLLIAIVAYIVTGYGVTEARIVERLTFGVLTKSLAFRIHDALTIPFVTLVAVHLALPSVLRRLGLKRD